MNKITLCAAVFLAISTLQAQTITFSNEDHLIGSYPTAGTDIAVDVNGDNLDDYVRIASGGVGIDYQNPVGTFTFQFYSMSIA